MAATAIFIHFRSNRHRRFLLHNATSTVRFYSSSDDNPISPPNSRYPLTDIKNTLKSTQNTRTTSFHNPIPNTNTNPKPKVATIEEIRKSLSKFQRKAPVQPSKSSAPVISFQELYQRDRTLKPDTGSGSGLQGPESLHAIRMDLKSIGSNPTGLNLKLRPRNLNEMQSDSTVKVEEFGRLYSYGDMGEKLRRLRPRNNNNNNNNKNVRFSLEELNERLQKVREMEEKAAGTFVALREGLKKLSSVEQTEKNEVLSISGLALGETNRFLLQPPNEVLVEKYFHPDHMSSAEKQKLELKKVRDKFKVSESDCGSARVQVAQLTTKIKHLATALHKKDKHSRKGLQAMVQKRKKLLKYLRRTDWDSYCFCLSELGLRDSADYKA